MLLTEMSQIRDGNQATMIEIHPNTPSSKPSVQLQKMENCYNKPLVSADSLAIGQSVCGSLMEEFGTRFWVFVKDGEWTRWSDHSCVADGQLHGVSELRDILSDLSAVDEVLFRASEDGRWWIIAPVSNSDSVPMVACGRAACADPVVGAKLARASLRSAEYRRQIDEMTSQLALYSQQVTTDFEELTWLRGLAEHVDLCGLQNDIAAVAEPVLASLAAVIHAESVVLMLAENHSSSELQGVYETRPTMHASGVTSVSADVLREVIARFGHIATRQPVVRNAASHGQDLDLIRGVRNLVLVRIELERRRQGWLLAINKQSPGADVQPGYVEAGTVSDWEFGTFEAGLLNSAGIMLASQARNAELFHEKESLLIGLIRALINAIDAKDAYTCGHSDRVALIAKRLAEGLNLGHVECERVYMAGLLHDIGKIGIPDSVLCKPGSLTDEEFAIIKKHPEMGHAILRHVPQLSHVLPGVLHHHENVDGGGYPGSLRGDEIPLLGRILAVADAYDAMTSSRPYRPAMPLEKAESILLQGRGTQWDPRIVDAFFEALADIRQISRNADDHTRDMLSGDTMIAGAGVSQFDAIRSAVSATAGA